MVVPAIEREEDSQQRTDEEQGFLEDVAHRPEKSTPFRETQEQRRIAQRRERAPGVGDDEDEEHHHMGHMLLRLSLARISGRMSSMDAPVVPMLPAPHPNRQDGRVEPGLPCRLPRMKMPPATVNSAVSRITNRMYSGQQRMHQAHARHCGPKVMARAAKRQAPGRSHLAKVVVPEDGAKSGMSAIDSRMPANGTPHSTDSVLPSISAAMHRPGNRAPAAATQSAARREIFMVLSPSMR